MRELERFHKFRMPAVPIGSFREFVLSEILLSLTLSSLSIYHLLSSALTILIATRLLYNV